MNNLIDRRKGKLQQYKRLRDQARNDSFVSPEEHKEIEKELAELDMEKAKFEVLVEHTDEFLKNGMDNVEFMISTNPGEPLKPLTKVASGGELSRTMLAIKTILAGVGDAGTLIFDEIDTGISGRAAGKVGTKLYEISNKKQVLCVTHLPQIAALSDSHFKISKVEFITQ